MAGALFQRLGRTGAPLAASLVLRCGTICAGAADRSAGDDTVLEDDAEEGAELRQVGTLSVPTAAAQHAQHAARLAPQACCSAAVWAAFRVRGGNAGCCKGSSHCWAQSSTQHGAGVEPGAIYIAWSAALPGCTPLPWHPLQLVRASAHIWAVRTQARAQAAGLAGPARAALGAAVHRLGPEAVLGALPLDLDKARTLLRAALLPLSPRQRREDLGLKQGFLAHGWLPSHSGGRAGVWYSLLLIP